MKIVVTQIFLLFLASFLWIPATADDSQNSTSIIERINTNAVASSNQQQESEGKNNSSSFGDTVIVALIGFMTGAIGSLFAPWVHWGIEKRRLKHNRRVELIKEWRAFIGQFDFENNNFGNTTVYGAMRPYMNEGVIKKFEAQRTFFVPPDGGRGENLFKQWASDEVSAIERKWGLI